MWSTRIKTVVLLLLAWAITAQSQIRVSVITDDSAASQAATVALRSKMNAYPKQFTVVSNNDSSKDLLVLVGCIPQKQQSDQFECFYVAHYAGGTSKTLLGGGVYSAATSDQIADNFLASVAQDIAERWNDTVRTNSTEQLEACLLLTQSSCKVPDALVPELKAKIINLSQYLQKGGLKK